MASDRFFKTGDIGNFHEDGYPYITDRKKQLIKCKGFQVAPAELAGLLIGHEKVVDACVLSVYEKNQATELPRAYVVKAESAEHIDELELAREIQEWIAGKVAPHKMLRGGIHFVDAITRSSAGNIMRRVLTAQAQDFTEKSRTKVVSIMEVSFDYSGSRSLALIMWLVVATSVNTFLTRNEVLHSYRCLT